jgi:hypothetical protein
MVSGAGGRYPSDKCGRTELWWRRQFFDHDLRFQCVEDFTVEQFVAQFTVEGELTVKVLIVVLSDPRAGGEAVGRLFDALTLVYDHKQKNKQVELLFQGTGILWRGHITKPDHPVHGSV